MAGQPVFLSKRFPAFLTYKQGRSVAMYPLHVLPEGLSIRVNPAAFVAFEHLTGILRFDVFGVHRVGVLMHSEIQTELLSWIYPDYLVDYLYLAPGTH